MERYLVFIPEEHHVLDRYTAILLAYFFSKTKSVKMSRHRIKNVSLDDEDLEDDYDYDDEYDAYNDGDGAGPSNETGISEDDKEQLQKGTVEVRRQLGPENPSTDEEIQESLWHYYYDIARSVTYLKSESRLKRPRVVLCFLLILVFSRQAQSCLEKEAQRWGRAINVEIWG